MLHYLLGLTLLKLKLLENCLKRQRFIALSAQLFSLYMTHRRQWGMRVNALFLFASDPDVFLHNVEGVEAFLLAALPAASALVG